MMGYMPIHPVAPLLSGPTLSAQRWQDLSFLHWPVAAEALQHFMPPGVRPDVIGGVSYVGLVPFSMRGAGPSVLATPYFGTFSETNVRLYSVDEQDRHGIVFLTLDATRLATVLLARIGLGLPYTWSRMSVTSERNQYTYRSERRWPDRTHKIIAGSGVDRVGPGGTITVRVGEPVVPTEVEVWLTARWGLHTRVAGRTWWVPNHHAPWPIHAAELVELDCDLVAACGVAVEPTEMLRPLWSPGVRTIFGMPSRVRSSADE
jgi:uncharacterized protein